jgi:hypothetical protein
MCGGTTGLSYSVTSDPIADSYNWTVPSGASITGGGSTNAITVTMGTTSGDVCVTATNICGTSSARCLPITVTNPPATPGTISGSTVVPPSTTGEPYSISAVTGATSYNWSTTAGSTIASGGGSTAVTVNFTGGAGTTTDICVTASNACGTSSPQCKTVTISPPSGSVTFSYTGSMQTWTVPAGVTSVSVDMRGAQGGYGPSSATPGYGGRLQCTIPVTGGEVLNIYVGGAGQNSSSGSRGSGGFNGGGNGGGELNNPAGAGGGASDIRRGGTALSNRILVAGAGGGATSGSGGSGGGGGGTTAISGLAGGGGSGGGTGGTQIAGGSGGSGTSSCSCPAGSSGAEGNGANGPLSTDSCCYGGAGGGGGYYGGGSGGSSGSGYGVAAAVGQAMPTHQHHPLFIRNPTRQATVRSSSLVSGSRKPNVPLDQLTGSHSVRASDFFTCSKLLFAWGKFYCVAFCVFDKLRHLYYNTASEPVEGGSLSASQV